MNPISAPASPDDLQVLAGEYVLGTLSATSRAGLDARMKHDAALRTAVEMWEEKLAPLAELVEPVEPSSALWSRIESSIAATTSARPFVKPTTSGWNSLNLWRSLAASGFATAAFLGVVVTTKIAQPPAPGYMVVLVGPQDKAPGWIVQAGTNSQQARLIPLGKMEVPSDRSLQFWTKGDDWKGPVSLGLVKPGQSLEIPLDTLPPLQPNQLFEITLEPYNGSPINRPTGPILFIGRAVKII